MAKDLSQMTLEELWQLFPIILKEPDPAWKAWYGEEEALLLPILADSLHRISHIGSTAIPGIWAKPTVDILVELKGGADFAALPALLAPAGYRLMSRSENRMSFNKGYTPDGFAEKVFHLHVRRAGDNNELYFRDWMREHPEDAKAYESLKLSLWKNLEHDRDGYTDAKADFVKRVTGAAKTAYQDRY